MKKRPSGAPAPAAKPLPDLFRIAFHNSPAMQTLTRTTDRVLVEVNDAFLKTLGYTRDEILGRAALEMNFWVRPEKAVPFREELAAKGFVRGHEVEIRTKAGEVRTVLLSADLLDIDGVPHVVAAGVDITERKEAEAQLRESERRLREGEALFGAAFHASPVLLTIARLADARFVQVNEAFVNLTGFTREEILGRTTLELGLWREPAERGRFFDLLRRDRVVRDFDCEIRTRSGRVHAMQLSAAIIEINREPHLITFGLDVSAQKQAQRTLRESEARLRALYESISAAVAVQDETGFLQINPASLKLFGTDRPEEILGRHPADFSAPVQPDGEDSATAAHRHMDRALAEGTHRFEWLARRLDGAEFPVEVTLTALQLEGRTVLQAVIIDLTERKRSEAELQHALAKERELNQLKSDFVALVSHEFRTPLEVIMSSAENLERYHDRLPQEKRTQLLRTVHKSVQRMSDMMEEVLLLGRLDSGGAEFKPAPLDLASFCQRVGDEMETATSRRCPIAVACGRLPPGAACADEALLRHILTNLLSNAVKYSEPGRPVELSVARRGEDAIFTVSDRGCGIPSADQARLFQAFHRGGNVRHVPGTGLGLVIVQRSVALHGGTIAVESAEGRGTTFTVTLPLFPGPSGVRSREGA